MKVNKVFVTGFVSGALAGKIFWLIIIAIIWLWR